MPLGLVDLKPAKDLASAPGNKRHRRGPVDIVGIFVMLRSRQARLDGYEEADNKYRMVTQTDALIEIAVFDLLRLMQQHHPDASLPTDEDLSSVKYLIGRKETFIRRGQIDLLAMSLEQRQRTHCSRVTIADYICNIFNTHRIIPGTHALIEHKDIVLVPDLDEAA